MTGDRLALIDARNEATAAVLNIERILLLSHLPAEFHEDVRLSDPADDESDLFALTDGAAIRVRRLADEHIALCEKFYAGEKVAEAVFDVGE